VAIGLSVGRNTHQIDSSGVNLGRDEPGGPVEGSIAAEHRTATELSRERWMARLRHAGPAKGLAAECWRGFVSVM
jgi:hypothetical protein